jgi:hypothetical protein
MPDWTKRIRKSRAKDIAGETLIAASYFLGRGSTTAQLMFGAVTSVGGAAFNYAAVQGRNTMLESAREGYHSPPGSLAASIPDSKGILAVTDKSLIVFGYRQGFFSTSIEDPVARIDRAHLVGWSLSPGKMASVLNLAFDDDSTQGIELPMANRPADFAAALDIPVLD